MNVSKLTITPWISNGQSQVFQKPTTQMAKVLMNERLSVAPIEDKTARVFRKLPKSLQGFVNKDCKVSGERKFSMDI